MKFTSLVLLSALYFSATIKAEDITLPVVQKPAALEEGTQRVLNPAQVAELLPWAKDSKLFLTDLLENIQGLTTTDKIDRLVEGLQQVVGESAPKNSELLMRYSLNRGLAIQDILAREADENVVGTADAKLRVLTQSIKLAIKYYDTDMATLEKKTIAPYVLFGLDYFNFLNEINKSVVDASAQYAIQRTALEWLQWDLYRDLNNMSYAPQIIKINNSLKTFPNRKLTDSQAIAIIRQMKKIALQLNVNETLKKVEDDRRFAEAKTEEQREQLRKEAEIERMKGNRTAFEMDQVKIYAEQLNVTSYIKRGEAVIKLDAIIGGDVTIILLNRLYVEKNIDVYESLRSVLNKRIWSDDYLMKIENKDEQNVKLLFAMGNLGKPVAWNIRQYFVNIHEHIGRMESYTILLEWAKVENDVDVSNTLRLAIASLEKKLNK
jgi:hypothetical protein